MVTISLGVDVAMVTIRFLNKEVYVRSAIHICVTCHARILQLQLGRSANISILVFLMISRTSVVISQRVSYKCFLIVIIVNVNKSTLIGSL